MGTQYRCSSEKRRMLVEASASLNGIDYLEVKPGLQPDQAVLEVYFLKPDGLTELVRENALFHSGVRNMGLVVASSAVVDGTNPRLWKVTVAPVGDYSIYTLRLRSTADSSVPPSGFDHRLSEIDFSFWPSAPLDFETPPAPVCVPATQPAPNIDYVARDYASFRRLMLDRLATVVPDWTERNPADMGMMLVEVLAYAADRLAYFQDAVATEAYLGTARQRTSVRRHARLLDYYMHEGCSARTWIHLTAAEGLTNGLTLEAAPGSSSRPRFVSRCSGSPIMTLPAFEALRAQEAVTVFEPLHDVTLYTQQNSISFYTWSDEQCCLPKGATRAYLVVPSGVSLHLVPGNLLLLEERLSPETGLATDADPARRHVVRLIETKPLTDALPTPAIDLLEVAWDAEEALPFPLCLSTRIDGQLVDDVSVARGNLVLASHGRTIVDEPLEPEVPQADSSLEVQAFTPHLRQNGLSFDVPYDGQSAGLHAAKRLLELDPQRALPAVTVSAGGQTWSPYRDLLSADASTRGFVVERDERGVAWLRFGNGILGRKPETGVQMLATYRTGSGRAGNVPADTLVHMATGAVGVTAVRNPLPAAGGADPETLDEVRVAAPRAFRTQSRAVLPEDYVALGKEHPGVRRAAATIRWTGSWYTAFITVERRNRRPMDQAVLDELLELLEPCRLAGYELRIESPRYVALDIAMTVHVVPGYSRNMVRRGLLEAFSMSTFPDGRRGLFHVDNFTFGQPVYLSQVVGTAMSLPGVQWVDFDDTPPKRNRFRRFGQLSQGESVLGHIPMERLEIARLENSPDYPEHGKIEFFMVGGI